MKKPGVISYDAFQNDAVNVIWREVQKMAAEHAENEGVVFECRYAEIWIHYVRGSSLITKKKIYPASLLADTRFAIDVIKRLAHGQDCKRLVRLSDGEGFNSNWGIYPDSLGDDWFEVFPALLERVDKVIALIDAPLEAASPVPQDLGLCPHCGVGMIMMDGSNDTYCPEGCTI